MPAKKSPEQDLIEKLTLVNQLNALPVVPAEEAFRLPVRQAAHRNLRAAMERYLAKEVRPKGT
jgi:hypothetical protein